MSAQRKAIRKKVVELLTGGTQAGANVYPSRAIRVSAEELPAILVYSASEDITVFDSTMRLDRALTLRVEIAAAANDELDDTLDDIAQQVEDIMSDNPYLDDLCGDQVISGVETTFTADGETQYGSCILSFAIRYNTEYVQDASGLDPFLRAHMDYEVSPSEQVSATDDVTLPQ